jgi:hypothetical protein
MMFRWSLGREDVAGAIEAAVGGALDDGYRTGDLVLPGGEGSGTLRRVGTTAMAEAIAGRIRILEAARATAAAEA